MKEYIRWDGYRLKHQGPGQGSTLVGHGWLCSKGLNDDNDPRVIIYFTAGVGYTFTYLP